VFTARYALSPYIKQIRFVFKGLTCKIDSDDNVKKDKNMCSILHIDIRFYYKSEHNALNTTHSFSSTYKLRYCDSTCWWQILAAETFVEENECIVQKH
jgi:hypothetical protein